MLCSGINVLRDAIAGYPSICDCIVDGGTAPLFLYPTLIHVLSLHQCIRNLTSIANSLDVQGQKCFKK